MTFIGPDLALASAVTDVLGGLRCENLRCSHLAIWVQRWDTGCGHVVPYLLCCDPHKCAIEDVIAILGPGYRCSHCPEKAFYIGADPI